MAIAHDWLEPVNMSVVQLLREWGSWGAMQSIGYPTMSPMFGERALKTPLYSTESPPPDVLAVEIAVGKIQFSYRSLLIEKYQLRLHWRDICKKWRWSKSTYFRNIEEAHGAVRKELG